MFNKVLEDKVYTILAFIVSLSPNPHKLLHWKVGAVLVKNGRFIKYARNDITKKIHAEEAIIRDTPLDLLEDATLYTTLAPCINRDTGRKSCSSLILETPIKKLVVLLQTDPNHNIRDYGLKMVQKKKEVVVVNTIVLKNLYILMNACVIYLLKKRDNG